MDTPAHPISIFDEDAVSEKLRQIPEEIKNRNVVIISIAGAFRLGKSFILNFLIRYMKYLCTPEDEKPSSTWLGDDESPLKGFSWRPGSERDTIGILMWSEIFPMTLPNGEEVAVIFLDTQGTFDNDTTVNECAKIFALSTMLCSVQVYNLSKKIKEDDLQYLQLFAEYGRLAAESTANKTLQNKLQFLVRDWSHPYDFEYGSAGGQKYVDKILKTSGKPPGLVSLRNNIKSSFDDIKCFLMPYPGVQVDTNPAFNGKLSDMETNFKDSLEDFVTELLSPQNMILKEINSVKINVNQWFMFLKRYINEFSHDSLPEPKSLFEATADANNLEAVTASVEMYYNSMKQAFECSEPFLTSEEFDNHHRKFKALAIEQFREKRKMGTEEFCESHRRKLEENIRSRSEQLKLSNQYKKETCMLNNAVKGKEIYNELTSLLENTKPYLSGRQFKNEHERFEKKALDFFDAQCENNVDELSKRHRMKLQEQIDTERFRLMTLNKHKAKAHNYSAMVAANKTYYKEMLDVIESSESYRTFEQLKEEHIKHKAAALQEFSDKCVDDEDELSKKYKKDLQKEMDDAFNDFKTLNKNKKISNIAARNIESKCENTEVTPYEMEKTHLKCTSPAKYEPHETQLNQNNNMDSNWLKICNRTLSYRIDVRRRFQDFSISDSEMDCNQLKTYNRPLQNGMDVRRCFRNDFGVLDNEMDRNSFQIRDRPFQNGMDVRRRVRDFGVSVCAVLSETFVGSPVGPLFNAMRDGFLANTSAFDRCIDE
ncbi:atlastin-like [Planococcus citri]|uniref:atlastin-like n=1 Tax=Planococcus citri TaxID=170843 RepID=UPI0031F78BCD